MPRLPPPATTSAQWLAVPRAVPLFTSFRGATARSPLVDLAVQLAHAPAEAQGFDFVEAARRGVLDGEQAHVGGLWQRERLGQ
jgi:hypothetical protein